MRVLTCTKPRHFEYSDKETPAITKNNAIIKIRRIGICGTDLHAFEGTQPYFNYPRILGHELAGELVHIDNAPGFHIGEAVTFVPYFNCGTCIACRMNKPNCCMHLQVCGVHVDGGMVEYLSVPSSSLVHSDGLGFDELALVEPLAIGRHGVQRAAVTPGEFALVVGAGPIGLGVMEFARIAGARVIALDINERRLRFCKEQLRVEHIINGRTVNVVQHLEEITRGDMPTVVIDATGNLEAIKQSFRYLAHGGRYVLVGLQRDDISFSHPEFHKREATLMSSRNATHDDFEFVKSCLVNHRLQGSKYISHRTDFDRVATEFPAWLSPGNDVIKVMVDV
jgi:2-desacetyl-2-hydroxyethyl bacteriochlorophyllide A dehydrogenase